MRCPAFLVSLAAMERIAHPAIAKVKFFHELAGGSYLRKILTETSEPVHSVREIPRYVIAAARRITGDDFRLANPDERYISGDARILPDDAGLPMRQLVFATRSSSHFIIFYRHGGYGQGQCVLAFSIDPARKDAQPVLVGCYLGSQPVTSLADLRRAIARNEVQQYRPTFLDF
jgi:hypothetical protein